MKIIQAFFVLASVVFPQLTQASLPVDEQSQLITKIRAQVSENSYNNTDGQAIDPRILKNHIVALKENLKNEGSIYEPQPFSCAWAGHKEDESYIKAPRSLNSELNLSLNNIHLKIYNQKGGTCTIYSLCAAIDYLRGLDREYQSITPRSPRFAYFLTRSVDLNHEDIGAFPRNLIGHLSTTGICSDDLWKFEEHDLDALGNLKPEAIAKRPTKEAYRDAGKNAIIGLNYIGLYKFISNNLASDVQLNNQSSRLLNIEVLLDYLDSYRRPIICTLNINTQQWDELYNPPPQTLRDIQNPHAVLIIGYNLNDKIFFIQNSWGPTWGGNGLAQISFEDVAKTAESDFWQITKIGNPYQLAANNLELDNREYEKTIRKVVMPFATKFGLVLDYFSQSLLFSAYSHNKNSFKETARYIFNTNFTLHGADLIDYIFILNTFTQPRNKDKRLDQFKSTYAFLKKNGFSYEFLKDVCKNRFDDWYRLKKLVKLIKEAKISPLEFNLASYSTRFSKETSFLEFAKRAREEAYKHIKVPVIPLPLSSESALFQMPVFECDEVVQPDNSITFRGVTLRIPLSSLKGSIVKIKQEFSNYDVVRIYYMDDTPVYGPDSQALRYSSSGIRIIQRTSIQASEIQIIDSLKSLQIGSQVGSQQQLSSFNPFINQIDSIINQGFSYHTFRQLIALLNTAYDRKFITKQAGYSGSNPARDYGYMYNYPSQLRWDCIVNYRTKNYQYLLSDFKALN